MEYLYLWGMHPIKGLILFGPYDGNSDKEYQERRAIMARSNVSPRDEWLGTRDANAATAILKNRYCGVTKELSDGLRRASHDIKKLQPANNQVFGGDHTI
jgi:hypothetical protein